MINSNNSNLSAEEHGRISNQIKKANAEAKKAGRIGEIKAARLLMKNKRIGRSEAQDLLETIPFVTVNFDGYPIKEWDAEVISAL